MREAVIAGYLRTAQSRARPQDPERDLTMRRYVVALFDVLAAASATAQSAPEAVRRKELGNEYLKRRDYDGAIEALEGLYAKADLDPELREEVLLKLGELYGSWMNANRDYEKGSRYLRQLLTEFPQTEQRERVTEMLSQYAKAAEKQ